MYEVKVLYLVSDLERVTVCVPFKEGSISCRAGTLAGRGILSVSVRWVRTVRSAFSASVVGSVASTRWFFTRRGVVLMWRFV